MMLSMRVNQVNSLCNIDDGNLITIAGYVGSGKSVYAENIAYYAALEGKHVVYIETEVSLDSIKNRFLKLHKYNNLSINDESSLNKNYEETIGGNITFIDFSKMQFSNLKKHITELQDQYPIDLIILDSFSSLVYKKNHPSLLEYLRYFQNIKDSFLSKPNICLIANTSRKGYLYAHSRSKISDDAEGTYKIDGITHGNKLSLFSDYIIAVYSSELLRLKNKIKLQVLKAKDKNPDTKPIEIGFLKDSETQELTIINRG